MRIVVPKFLLPELKSRAGSLPETITWISVNREGLFSAPPQDVEVVVLPWNLQPEAMRKLVVPSVRWFHSVSAGVDDVLESYLRDHPAVLTNARGVFDVPIAETVLAYILMIVKRMPELFRQQQEHRWKVLPLREVTGLTVGLIGTGGIGREIACRCHALGMRVVATRRHPDRPVPCVDALRSPAQLSELLTEADFVVVAVPSTPETRGLLGAEQFATMRPSAWLINIARGAIVDEAALLAALQGGQIAGAALDVFAQEPLPPDSPLWEMSNVILTPHNSWSTPHLLQREAALFCENLRRYLSGQPLRNVVDKERGY